MTALPLPLAHQPGPQWPQVPGSALQTSDRSLLSLSLPLCKVGRGVSPGCPRLPGLRHDLKGPLGVYGLHIHCHCLIIPISQMNRTRYREGEWFSVLVPGEPLQVHCVGPSRPWGQGPGSGDFESIPRGCWCEVSVPPFLGWNRALGLGETLTNCRTQRGATVSWCPPPPPPGGICGHTVYLDDTGCRKVPRALRRAPLSAESRKGHGRGPQMLRPYNPRALLWVAG